jgi:O-antigen/teichoic acid export membrane protein
MQLMLSLYKEKELLAPSIYAAILNLFLGSLLIYFYAHNGAAISVCTVEFFMLIYFYLLLKKFGIEIIRKHLVYKLLSYAGVIAGILSLLKIVYMNVSLRIITKLPVTIAIYGICILIILRVLNMVDYKNRKIILEQAPR